MSLGIRENAEKTVRSGIRFVQFAQRPEEDAVAIDAYLKDLKPVVTPRRVNEELSAEARKGKEVFARAGCAPCPHGGRAATLVDALTKCNPGDRHGTTSTLTPEKIKQLAECVFSL